MLVLIGQDYKFNYSLIGDRRKPVILFLHGFMGSCHDFSVVIEQLSEFCCLVVDLPGHGRTEVSHDTNYQMPQIAEALTALLEQLNIEKCYLVGYSMGGRLALYLAVYYSSYFWGVVLESASPGLKTQPERDRRIAHDFQLARDLESSTLSQFVQRWYANPLFNSFVQHPNYCQAIVQRLKNNPFKLAKSLRYMSLGAQPSLWDNLGKMQIPLILIVGSLDLKFITINQKIADLCSLARLNLVENTGHNIHFEQPLEFADLIKNLRK